MLKRITATAAIAACLTVLPATAAHAQGGQVHVVTSDGIDAVVTTGEAVHIYGPEYCGFTSGEFAQYLAKYEAPLFCSNESGPSAIFTEL